MTRHVLKTDGAWVELRDVEDLRGRDRKAVNAIVMAAIQLDDDGNVVQGAESVSQIVDAAPEAVAAQLVSSWEIPYLPDALIPRLEPENLGELKLDDYDRLRELVAPAVAMLMPRSSTDPSDYEDAQSPSGPVSA